MDGELCSVTAREGGLRRLVPLTDGLRCGSFTLWGWALMCLLGPAFRVVPWGSQGIAAIRSRGGVDTWSGLE